MEVIVDRSSGLTISAELQNVLLYRVDIVLTQPERGRLSFLAGLIQLALSQVAIATAVSPRTEVAPCSNLLETVCKPIVKTGPPGTIAALTQLPTAWYSFQLHTSVIKNNILFEVTS